MATIGTDDKELINEALQTKGLSGVKDVLIDRLDEWKRQDLNIAVVGMSGVGKSSFINAMRNLKPYDKDRGAAEVGITETTMEIKSYQCPENPKLTYWDIPGVGTDNFPQENYLDVIKFDTYDIFLILSKGRFFELDYWLGNKVVESGRHCLLARTNIDTDLTNAQKINREKIDEAAIIESLREHYRTHAEKIGHDIASVFLISNDHVEKYDFPELKERIIKGFHGPKKEAIMMSLAGLSGQTKAILEQKKQMLAARINGTAIASAMGALTPIPGVSIGIDMALLANEYMLYRRQFGLDNASIACLSETLNIPIESLTKRFGLAFDVASKITALLASQATSEGVENVVRLALPVIGSVVASGISYGCTYLSLKKLLNETYEEGQMLLDFMNEKIRDQV